jgi:hypothetical protein
MNPTEFKNAIMPLQDKLYRLALRLLSSREEAEDLLQDALLKLWQQGARLKEVESLEAWSARVANITRNGRLNLTALTIPPLPTAVWNQKRRWARFTNACKICPWPNDKWCSCAM